MHRRYFFFPFLGLSKSSINQPSSGTTRWEQADSWLITGRMYEGDTRRSHSLGWPSASGSHDGGIAFASRTRDHFLRSSRASSSGQARIREKKARPWLQTVWNRPLKCLQVCPSSWVSCLFSGYNMLTTWGFPNWATRLRTGFIALEGKKIDAWFSFSGSRKYWM